MPEVRAGTISISEYAKLTGISRQAVYKRLNTSLREFVKEVDGKKRLAVEALPLGLQNVVNQSDNESKPSVNQSDNESKPSVNQSDNESKPSVTHLEPILEQQLNEKDKVIDNLLEQIKALQEQNGQLTELLRNSQLLLAAEKKILISSGNTQDEPKKRSFWSLFKKSK